MSPGSSDVDTTNPENKVESAEQSTTKSGTDNAAGESTSYSKDSHAACLAALTPPESANSSSFLPRCEIGPPGQSARQAPESQKPADNADKVNAPKESDRSTDNPADPHAADKQRDIAMLEKEATMPGTDLYKAIQEYKNGEAQNDAANPQIANVHDANVHGFMESSRPQLNPGLENSSEVRPGLYRGASPGGSGDGAAWSPKQLITNLVNLKYDQGVNTVVSFEEKTVVNPDGTTNTPKPDFSVAGKIDAEQAVCQALHMDFHNIPLDQNTTGQKLSDQAQSFVDLVNTKGVVAYGHCREGIDRTGYMMAQAEMTPPKDANGNDVVPAKSAQAAAQGQVENGYGEAKRKDYKNLYLIPKEDYQPATTWTEQAKNKTSA